MAVWEGTRFREKWLRWSMCAEQEEAVGRGRWKEMNVSVGLVGRVEVGLHPWQQREGRSKWAQRESRCRGDHWGPLAFILPIRQKANNYLRWRGSLRVWLGVDERTSFEIAAAGAVIGSQPGCIKGWLQISEGTHSSWGLYQPQEMKFVLFFKHLLMSVRVLLRHPSPRLGRGECGFH